MKETALERLSRIKTQSDFENWLFEGADYSHQSQLIQEIVALAKANQQPSIDGMRFEAASKILAAKCGNTDFIGTDEQFAKASVKQADALMLELQNS